MNKQSPLYLAIFLAIVAAIAGGALYGANSLTLPIIKANEEKAEKASLLEMYPDASIDDFTTVDVADITPDHPFVDNVYTYGENVVIFKCSVSGYDGGTVFLVGIDKANDVVDAFQAISNADTKGIGSKITESAFKDSIVGKQASGQLDTISGATYTSTPVVQAINECATIATEIE
ncbi:FMN-binding protein [Erysipelotrichaceae bacterium RD49]|nr:FMN-binding protein [Erysipelotrichaceae bacterium RD49]